MPSITLSVDNETVSTPLNHGRGVLKLSGQTVFTRETSAGEFKTTWLNPTSRVRLETGAGALSVPENPDSTLTITR